MITLTKCSTTCSLKLLPFKFKTSRFEVLVKACKITAADTPNLLFAIQSCFRWVLFFMTSAKSSAASSVIKLPFKCNILSLEFSFRAFKIADTDGLKSLSDK